MTWWTIWSGNCVKSIPRPQRVVQCMKCGCRPWRHLGGAGRYPSATLEMVMESESSYSACMMQWSIVALPYMGELQFIIYPWEEYTLGIHIIQHFCLARACACGSSNFCFSHTRFHDISWISEAFARYTIHLTLCPHFFLIPNRWDWSRLLRWMWTLPSWRAFGALQNWLKRIICTSPRCEGCCISWTSRFDRGWVEFW